MKLLSIVAGLVSLAIAAPTPEPQVPTSGNIIHPAVRSQYYVSSGRIVYNTGVGLISKNSSSSDITTLLTINVPAAAAGRTGTFNFALDNAAATTVSGSGLLDIFSSLQPATASAASWPPGNQRNNQIGRFKVVKNAAATSVFGSTTFTIPAAGSYGYELVGVYDSDLISYSGSNNGFWISYV
jgi:hypothetical protein